MDNILRTNGGLRELALFAGGGGGILGGHLLGWQTVCAVEINPYASSVLAQRQNDGILPPFPIWDDVCTFEGRRWRGLVDVVSGGFPCQDISAAGSGLGLEGARSSLFFQVPRIVCEVEPKFVFLENSPEITRRGMGTVLSEMARLGMSVVWTVLGAHHLGASQKRERAWILAYADEERRYAPRQREIHFEFQGEAAIAWEVCPHRKDYLPLFRRRYTGEILSRAFRGCDDVACRVDRLEAVGNGQVPAVAAVAWSLLHQAIREVC